MVVMVKVALSMAITCSPPVQWSVPLDPALLMREACGAHPDTPHQVSHGLGLVLGLVLVLV